MMSAKANNLYQHADSSKKEVSTGDYLSDCEKSILKMRIYSSLQVLASTISPH